jgi:lysophospholipase L1-like esterase
VRSHERNWNAIVDELVALRASPAVPLLTFDIYTPFVPPGTRADALLEHLDEMNTAIWASHGRRGVHVGAAERLLEGSTESLLADDGLHPNAAGHRALARILLDLPVTPAG